MIALARFKNIAVYRYWIKIIPYAIVQSRTGVWGLHSGPIASENHLVLICQSDIHLLPQKMLKNECDRLRSALLGQYEMMKNGELCDFHIVVADRVFPVHKMILASRSPYFRTLFSCSMAESEENLLRLDDIELDIFHKLLKYVYTCDFEDLSNEEALKLILHGEKYGLEDLVDHCEAYLLKNINNEVAARCLLAGDLLERKELKSRALSLLRRNWQAVFSTDGWNDFVSSHPLMTEMEKIECSERKLIDAPVGRMKWDATTGEVKWLIPILSLYGTHSSVESHAFSLLGDDELFWRFRISYADRMGPYTVSLSHFGPPVVTPVTCSFAVSRNIAQGGKLELCTGSIDTSCCFLQNSSCQMVLTTFSMGNMYSDRDFIYVIVKKSSEKIVETSSMDYLSEYLENSCFTDAVIKVGGEEFSVHKIILSAASPIFLEKFQNQGSFFELSDKMDPDTFRNLLLIIYQSQEIPNPLNFDLLAAAKRYQLSNKQINRCRATIFRAMKDSYLIDFLIEAHAQQDPILKRMAFKHMAHNFEAVVQLDDWNQMSKHSDLHDEFFKYVVSSKKMHE